jgi:hypothetical protein
MGEESPEIRIAGRSISPRRQLALLCAIYLTLSGVFGSVSSWRRSRTPSPT